MHKLQSCHYYPCKPILLLVVNCVLTSIFGIEPSTILLLRIFLFVAYCTQGTTTRGSVELTPEMAARVEAVEKENLALRKTVSGLQSQVELLAKRLAALEGSSGASTAAPATAAAPADDADDDDDFDLFGGDDEDDEAEAERVKAERIAAYQERKAAKKQVIAKSNIILDVKPWDDETDMKEIENAVRSIEVDGLLWGTSKLAEVGYGIKKLVISCVVEDDKVGTDILEEKITEFEELVSLIRIAGIRTKHSPLLLLKHSCAWQNDTLRIQTALRPPSLSSCTCMRNWLNSLQLVK